MRAVVEGGFAEHLWPGDADRLYATPGWLRANVTRPGGRPFTVRAGGGDGVSVLAFLDKGDESSEAYDLVRTTVRWPLVFPWTPEGEGPLRAALDRRPGTEAALLPSLRAVLPGYELAVAGPHDPGLLDAAVSRLIGLARDQGAATCAFLYVPRDAAAVRRVLAGHGFTPVALTSRGLLRVRWTDLAGYAAALRPGRGRKVRVELRKVDAMGLTSRRADPLEGLEAITRLRCAHLTKFGRVPDEAAERARMAGVLAGFPPESLRLVLTAHEGRDVACLLLVRHRDTVYAALSATDPGPGLGLAHFENAYYAPIRLGLYRPGDVVDYGISHLDAKAWRGCDPCPLDAWVLAFDDDVHAVLRTVSGLSFRYSEEAPGRPPGEAPGHSTSGAPGRPAGEATGGREVGR
ncbi:hypothetical protein [Sphaerisporangium aureirubrum]|uniref:GNAT family N-acetyltransferase n=1 Tax=Sphaerisporangium aureirubrum TaxID=1544736 RepID=A0ABW1NN94_9ACTN